MSNLSEFGRAMADYSFYFMITGVGAALVLGLTTLVGAMAVPELLVVTSVLVDFGIAIIFVLGLIVTGYKLTVNLKSNEYGMPTSMEFFSALAQFAVTPILAFILGKLLERIG